MRQAHNEYLITPIKNHLYLMLMPLKQFSNENKINDLSMGIFTFYFSFLLFLISILVNWNWNWGIEWEISREFIQNPTWKYLRWELKKRIPMQDNINEMGCTIFPYLGRILVLLNCINLLILIAYSFLKSFILLPLPHIVYFLILSSSYCTISQSTHLLLLFYGST